MDAPSDGAIVITIPPPAQTRATARQIARWLLPDAIIAFVLGMLAGTVIDYCTHC